MFSYIEWRMKMEKVEMKISDAAELFKILGDTSRLSMVAMMNKKECCVCDFTECFGMSEPAFEETAQPRADQSQKGRILDLSVTR